MLLTNTNPGASVVSSLRMSPSLERGHSGFTPNAGSPLPQGRPLGSQTDLRVVKKQDGTQVRPASRKRLTGVRGSQPVAGPDQRTAWRRQQTQKHATKDPYGKQPGSRSNRVLGKSEAVSPPYDQNMLFNALTESVQREQLQKGKYQELIADINARQATETAQANVNNSIQMGF